MKAANSQLRFDDRLKSGRTYDTSEHFTHRNQYEDRGLDEDVEGHDSVACRRVLSTRAVLVDVVLDNGGDDHRDTGDEESESDLVWAR